MRITDPQVIQDGEQDLIASVQRDLDLEAVKDLLKKRLTASELSPKGGRIVVHDNDVAFRLDYEINLNGSLLFDRNGNLIEDEESSAPEQDLETEDEAAALGLDENLSIELPDYDDALNETSEKIEPEVLESEDAFDDIQNVESKFEIEDPEDDTQIDQDELDSIEAEGEDELIDDLPHADEDKDLTVDELTDLGLEEGDKESDEQVDVDDDDISELLQESRDFWENKKE
ncbi:hypothetical protein [uncultured Desulfobacter sp.]|uniref:hypothetical protein n=1 Tax=uncultured Desulfobacter sp. TaxID=240139 RepID=UPI0029F51AC4|nr:hypothetical protein [uncultured Desulfobacter sp.]